MTHLQYPLVKLSSLDHMEMHHPFPKTPDKVGQRQNSLSTFGNGLCVPQKTIKYNSRKIHSNSHACA